MYKITKCIRTCQKKKTTNHLNSFIFVAAIN